MKNYVKGTPEYDNFVDCCKSDIYEFIKNHKKYVKYDTTQDGYVYITLIYGPTRNKKLKELARLFNEGSIQECVGCGVVPAKITYASEYIIKYKGLRDEIESFLLNGKERDRVQNLVDIVFPSNTANITENLVNNIMFFVQYCVSNRSMAEKYYDEWGITYSETDLKCRVGLKVDYIEKMVINNKCVGLMRQYHDTIIEPLLDVLKTKPELITNELSPALAKSHIYIERINENRFLFSADPIVWDEDRKDDYFYDKTPGEAPVLFVHIGNFEAYETDNTDLVTDIDGAKRLYNNNFKMTSVDKKLKIPFTYAPNTNQYDILNCLIDSMVFRDMICNGEYYFRNLDDNEVYPITYESFDNSSYVNYILSSCYIASSDLISANRVVTLSGSQVPVYYEKYKNKDEKYFEDNVETLDSAASIIAKAVKDGRALDIVIPLDPSFNISNVIKREENM